MLCAFMYMYNVHAFYGHVKGSNINRIPFIPFVEYFECSHLFWYIQSAIGKVFNVQAFEFSQ